MRIVLTTLFQRGYGGGIGRVTEALAEKLLKQHKVIIIRSAEQHYENKLNSKLTEIGIEGFGKGERVFPVLRPAVIDYIYNVLAKFKPDIIHCQDEGPISFVCLFWAKQNNVPVIFTKHILPNNFNKFYFDNIVNKFNIFDSLKLKISSALMESYFNFFMQKVDGFIALNQVVYNLAAKNNEKIAKKSVIISNGVDFSTYERLKLPKITNKIIRLIFVGNLCHRKNQLYLVSATKHLDPNKFKLILVGPVLDNDYFNKIKDYINKNKIKNIEFKGKVNTDQVKKLLEKSHFFVSASVAEVQSLSVLEAMSAGKPIIALKNETTQDFVNKENGVLLPKNTPVEIFAQEIQKLAKFNQDQYLKLCYNSRKKVKPLDWKYVLSKLNDFYKKVIDQNKKTDSSASLSGFIKQNLHLPLNTMLSESAILLLLSLITVTVYNINRGYEFIDKLNAVDMTKKELNKLKNQLLNLEKHL